MKKSSGVRLQELPFLPTLQCCHTDKPMLNFSSPLFSQLVYYSVFIHLSLQALQCFLALHFCPDGCPFLDLFLPFTPLFSMSLPSPSLLQMFLSYFPQGLPVWYSACVVGQDGLEHGQAPQTTLIYRTAFQSLFHCCSTYINTSTGRELQNKWNRKNENNREELKQTGKDKCKIVFSVQNNGSFAPVPVWASQWMACTGVPLALFIHTCLFFFLSWKLPWKLQISHVGKTELLCLPSRF